jgi:hypothetical protein
MWVGRGLLRDGLGLEASLEKLAWNFKMVDALNLSRLYWVGLYLFCSLFGVLH